MAKELKINGKIYYPSAVLSGRFSYTSDYLSKLAREGKVTATRVGRQWFIDEDSVVEFAKQAEAEKAKRKIELREERKVERVQHQKNIFENSSKITPEPKEFFSPSFALEKVEGSAVALAQAVAIVMCGTVLGLLGFTVVDENLKVTSIVDSSIAIGGEIKQAVTFDVRDFSFSSKLTAENNQMAGLSLSGFFDWLLGRKVIVETETVKPVVVDFDSETAVNEKQEEAVNSHSQKALVMLDGDRASTSLDEIRDSFSDEVEVVFDGEDTGMIRPVFKEKTGESYRFLLVPVNDRNE